MSVSELIWDYFIIKKSGEIKESDIKIGGYIERKLCVCFRSFKPHSCWQREVIFSQISHFMVENDRKIGLKLKYLFRFD